MTAPLVVLALFASAVASAMAAVRHRRRRLPAHAVIVSPRHSTVVQRDGAVRSVQSANLTMAAAECERLWTPPNLENLGATYWEFLSKVTLRLIRVVYTANSRSVVLIARPFTLLRFDAPEYTIEHDHGAIRWRIRDGLLVARNGRGCGYLALDVRREPPRPDGLQHLHIEVEVANFYPSIAVGFSVPVYEMTQSSIHVLVTHAFLRSLARLHLTRSKVGALAEDETAPPAAPGPPAAAVETAPPASAVETAPPAAAVETAPPADQP